MRESLARLGFRFGPPVGWMGVIALLSTAQFGADRTGSIFFSLFGALWPDASAGVLHGLHTIVRKMAHLAEYGVLGALWLSALAPGRAPATWSRPAALAVALAAAYAGFDEGVLQALAPNRSPAVVDVLIDTAGAALGIGALQGHGPLLRLVLTAGAAGAGLLAAASLGTAAWDARLGLPAWDLIAAAGGASGLAWALWRAAARAGRGGGFTAKSVGVSSSPRPSPPRASV